MVRDAMEEDEEEGWTESEMEETDLGVFFAAVAVLQLGKGRW